MEELTVVVAAHTRPPQVQARQNPSVEKGGGDKVLAPAEELPANHRCREGRSQFSLRVEPLVDQVCSSRTHI